MAALARRQLMLATGAGLLGWRASALALAPRALVFPRDHGSHPDLRTEWWYITGQARSEDARLWGFQITFFRSRVDVAQGLRSAFAARQLIFAHAALTDVQGARQWHDQRIARAGFGVAGADEDDARIRLHDWSLERTQVPDIPGHSRWAIRAQADGFALDVQCTSTQPVLLQGQAGLSRKGPEASQASYYVSQPQLAVTGALTVAGQRIAIAPDLPAPDNRAWMDHEWSEALMHPQAVGWDWIGMNLLDGGALTAFRLRRADGSALWAGGSLRRTGESKAHIFGSDEVTWTPLRRWISGASGATYPVDWRVDTPAGCFTVQALLDAQELDSRASTGAIYWEGLSELRGADGRTLGRGYLEMTGYAQRLHLG
ncbi:lipocalin-like domain-containing protein [Melaminivora jejuensis]|uniref:lipocalin-like domain-containing protein n=1 Tax=Melaminivora jejuensis TaxID=1267217 RepID=UPI001AE02E3D|nr:carotenoid 1,2-hydratase [Melaminivora jejuensis]UHJ65889.1 carotenoid 1,2-hydratase [Melaminivora jejuensis]